MRLASPDDANTDSIPTFGLWVSGGRRHSERTAVTTSRPESDGMQAQTFQAVTA